MLFYKKYVKYGNIYLEEFVKILKHTLQKSKKADVSSVLITFL